MPGSIDNTNRLQPYKGNAWYWQYNGKPVLLLGGSVEDNLFQIPDVEEHLDLLRSVGGNYVRCTMSSRDEGNVWPFERGEDGLYDLEKPGVEFWGRFKRFLDLCRERDIIVQIEVWATFDFYRSCWDANPFNPKNNCNYSADEAKLPVAVSTHPTKTGNPFFWSVPKEHDNRVVLEYQKAFVDKMLSCSLDYGNVLYCMDNETSVTPEWGKYWSEYIKSKAADKGLTVETTEMWDPWDLSHPWHAHTFNHPETYSFVDISQNNHNSNQMHWDNMQKQRDRVKAEGVIRPITNVKIYGNDEGRFGASRDGQERFWRNIFGGCSSARFHRPVSGQGLNSIAQAHIRSLRMLTDEMGWWKCEPHNELLSERGENEAYCFANPGSEYAVFFPDGGEVVLDVSGIEGKMSLRWLDIMKREWQEPESAEAGNLHLKTPTDGYWAILVRIVE